MFSGLIGYRGSIVALDRLSNGGVTLTVRCEGVQIERPQPKDSISIDGVCLTATAIDGELVVFDVIPETLARSALGDRAIAELVNVEYALRVGDRLGGHMVYGHVDATAKVLERVREGQGERMRIESPASLTPLIAVKGFIAVDGVSLTVAAAEAGWFEIAVIPETLARTTLGTTQPGDRVNLEVDPIARYVHATLAEHSSHCHPEPIEG